MGFKYGHTSVCVCCLHDIANSPHPLKTDPHIKAGQRHEHQESNTQMDIRSCSDRLKSHALSPEALQDMNALVNGAEGGLG